MHRDGDVMRTGGAAEQWREGVSAADGCPLHVDSQHCNRPLLFSLPAARDGVRYAVS